MIDLKTIKFTDLLGDAPIESTEPEAEPVETTDETPAPEPQKKPEQAKPVAATEPDPEPDPEPESESEEEEQEDSSVINTLANKIGYQFEEGEEFPDNEDGLVEFTKKASEKLASQQLVDFFSQMPDVEEYTRYRINGGDPAKYFETLNQLQAGEVQLKEDDDAGSKQVLNKFLTKQGYDADEIKEIITDYEDTGLLYKQAVKAQSKLKKFSETERQQLLVEQQKAKEKESEENAKLWNSIEGTIKGGVIKGIQIPETEKNKFFEWMAKPVDKAGRSARDIAREKVDTETMVAMEYLLYKGMDLKSLVMAKAKTLEAQELRKKLGGSSSGKKLSGAGSTQTKRPVQLPDLKDLL